MKSKINNEEMVGRKYGKLTVLDLPEKRFSKNGKPFTAFKCLCDCGNITYATKGHLLSGHTKSCGCMCSGYAFINNRNSIIGQVFGRLVVTEELPKILGEDGRYRIFYKCKCECGNIINVARDHLLNEDTKSCGCYAKETASDKYLINIIGKRFGKLVVVERAKNRYLDKTYWKCICDCGNTTEVSSVCLRKGYTKSCGCAITGSFPVMKISSYLNQLGYSFKREYTFEDLKLINRLRFDYAILDSSNNLICLIEYQGEQHYRTTISDDFGKQQREITDQIKKDYCSKNNISLFEIRYDEDILNSIINIILEIDFIQANTVPSA